MGTATPGTEQTIRLDLLLNKWPPSCPWPRAACNQLGRFSIQVQNILHTRRTRINPTPPTTATNLTESVPDGDPLPTVNLTPIVSTAVAAIKELALIVQRLTSRVAELEAKLAAAR